MPGRGSKPYPENVVDSEAHQERSLSAHSYAFYAAYRKLETLTLTSPLLDADTVADRARMTHLHGMVKARFGRCCRLHSNIEGRGPE